MSNKCSFILLIVLILTSCQTIDVYEKTTAFPLHSWKSAEKPSFTFEITDTTRLYNIFFVLRHEDAYAYNNIWVNLTLKGPREVVNVRREFILGNNRQGWLGSGMDDVFEHRLSFSDKPAPLHKGVYTFTLQQDMREDPLDHILNAGIRVEKVKQP
ncbi:MAG: gliding motility lipoprotein GldH [Bacteroidota bacterium]|nr:gliding motility lipoprotein GldH [Bacteroidota bacterium]